MVRMATSVVGSHAVNGVARAAHRAAEARLLADFPRYAGEVLEQDERVTPRRCCACATRGSRT